MLDMNDKKESSKQPNALISRTNKFRPMAHGIRKKNYDKKKTYVVQKRIFFSTIFGSNMGSKKWRDTHKR